MLMRIVEQISGKTVSLYTQAYLLVTERLLPSAKQLLVNITQPLLDAVNQVAKTIRNIKALVVSQTTADQSTNLERINAKAEVTLLGLQPQTIVPQTHQPVVQAQSLKRGKRVASIKSDKLSLKETLAAQTPTVRQSTTAGVKSQGTVSLPHQPARPTQNTKHRHAERTKSGKFAPKGTGVAPTHTGNQSQGNGTPRKTPASQHRQPVIAASKKGR